MDAFYASVEQRDNPALRGQPVIVGAPATQRGVVCAASYEARKFGMHSAMPSATAGRLCPKGIFVRPCMEHYREEPGQIMQIVAKTGAVVEQMSIDEAYVDVSALCQGEDADASLLGAVPLARELKQGIHSERRLTATIGVAANKLHRLGCSLLGREKLGSRPLRLLGLGVASLREPSARQLVLL